MAKRNPFLGYIFLFGLFLIVAIVSAFREYPIVAIIVSAAIIIIWLIYRWSKKQ